MRTPEIDRQVRKGFLRALITPGILFVILILLFAFARSTNGVQNTNVLLIFTLLSLCLGLFIIGLASLRRIRRANRQAENNEPGQLAAHQPIADEQALSLPTVLEVKASKGKYILVHTGLYTLCDTIITLLAAAQQNTLSFDRFTTILLLALSIGLLLGMLNFFLLGKSLGQTLTVDEHGISVVNSQQNMYIDWRNARFFGLRQNHKPGTVGLYELSCDQAIVRWWWLRPTHSLFNFLQPTIPYDEYTRKMANLLSLIAAKTHLPLHEIK